MKTIQIITILILLSFVEGNSTNKEHTDIKTITINPDAINQSIDLSPLLDDSFDIIPLETREECLISDIKKMELHNDKIFISDRTNQTIFIFDTTGKFIKNIGKKGNGPGEYAYLGDFFLIGDSIFIQDTYRKKYIIYDINKSSFSEIPYQTQHHETIPFGNKLYFISNYFESELGNYNLFLFNLQTLKTEKKQLPFSPEKSNLSWRHLHYASKYEDKALLIYPVNDTIYEVSKDKVSPKYLIQFTTRNLPESSISENKENLYGFTHQQKFLKGLDYIQNTKNFILGFYIDGSKRRFTIIDKKTNLPNVGEKYIIGDLGDLFIYDFYVKDEYLISTQNAYVLLCNWKSIYSKNNFKNPNDKKRIEAVLASTNEESNPILFRYKLKQ